MSDRLGQGAVSEEPPAAEQAWAEYEAAQMDALGKRAERRLNAVESHLSRALGDERAEMELEPVRNYIRLLEGRAA